MKTSKKQKPKKEKVFEHVQNFYIMLALVILVIVSIPEAVVNVKEWVNNVNARDVRERQVSSLKAGYNLDFFKSKLGVPAVTRGIDLNQDQNNDLEEDVFISDWYYLQTISQKDGSVVFFAVTTRDKKFNPVFEVEGEDYKIGKVGYSDLSFVNDFVKIDGYGEGNFDFYSGENEYGYYEKYHLGSTDDHQDFYFGTNMAGNYGDEYYFSEIDFNKAKKGNLAEIKKLRSNLIINTYAETAPWEHIDFDIEDLSDANYLGVDFDVVRVLE